MKKIKLFVLSLSILLFIFGLNFILNATEVDNKIDISLTTYFDDDIKVTNKLESEYGSIFTLDSLEEMDNYQFTYWIINGVVKDYPLDKEFIITEDMEITLVFKPIEKYVVLFMDNDYGLLDIQYLLPGNDATDPNIIYPEKEGFRVSNEKWNRSLFNINNDEVITLLYEPINQEKYLIEVHGGEILNSTSNYYYYNDIITIKAIDIPNKYFKYWVVNGQILSNQKTYSFTVMKEMNIYAIYDDYVVEDYPLINLSEAFSIHDGENSYKGQFYLPEGYTLIEYGIISSRSDEIITLDSQYIIKKRGTIYNQSTNEFQLSFPKEKSVSARSYLICMNHNNDLITVYNEVFSIEIKNMSLSIKTDYYIDDSLDLNNASLTINYLDNSTEVVELTENMIINFNTSNVGKHSLIVYFQGYIEVIEYTVSKKKPHYEIPVINPIEYYEGLKLGDINLPDGFSWNEPDTLLNIGISEHLVTFTPSDTNKYETINDIIVSVEVKEKTIPLTEIIIYEIYGGGGNSGAIYNHDYVILYNNTYNDIDLSNYSLQYASSSSSNYNVLELSGFIKAKDYYLIQLGSSNENIGNNLPVKGNISFNLNISATSGKLALVNSKEKISSSKHSTVIDFVGYGAADDSEKNPTNNLSATKSAKRNSFIDTNNNASDFTVGNIDLSYFENSLELVKISVANLRSYYELHDELNLTNALLILHYSNYCTNEITLISDFITGFDSSSYGEFEMTITFGAFSTTYPYYIVDYSSLDEAYVYYIDIGDTGGKAGEATLIKIGNIEILIDSGDDDSLSKAELLNFLETKIFDGTIEYVIATHPDSDHIGGMDVVYETYLVENTILYSTTNFDPTNLVIEFENIVELENTNVFYINDIVNTDPILELTEGFILKFYDTNYLTSSNKNASSIVFTFEAFNTRLLFNGDAESSQELIYAPLVGDVDIFKLGHHGSKNGTSTYLLETITPEVAIVSNGDYLGNQYNHPTFEAVSRIYQYSPDIQVYAVTGGNGSNSDRSYQRNGDITITINIDGYEISSQYYNNNPLELRLTDYWNDLVRG